MIEVQEKFSGCTYQTLEEKDKIRLRDSIIHATIVKQESPKNDDTSIYHIFERLNNGGRRLTPQQIRTAIYHGTFMTLVETLNEYEKWRKMFGNKNALLKDEELILRFFALYFELDKYERPMKEFLNEFAYRHQNANTDFIEECRKIFTVTVDAVYEMASSRAFRIERVLNAAVLDSVMYGVAKRLDRSQIEDYRVMKQAYDGLLENSDYRMFVSRATADEANLRRRMDLAAEAFMSL